MFNNLVIEIIHIITVKISVLFKKVYFQHSNKTWNLGAVFTNDHGLGFVCDNKKSDMNMLSLAKGPGWRKLSVMRILAERFEIYAAKENTTAKGYHRACHHTAYKSYTHHSGCTSKLNVCILGYVMAVKHLDPHLKIVLIRSGQQYCNFTFVEDKSV